MAALSRFTSHLTKLTKSCPISIRAFSDEVPKEVTKSTAKPGRRDKLYEKISIEVRAHQPEVLKSYHKFARTAADNLDVQVTKSYTEPEPHRTRKTLLKAAFAKKKHRVQYEFRYVRKYFMPGHFSWIFLFQDLLPHDGA